MRNSTGGMGLPLRMTCTYDIIYLEGYDYTTYNSVMYLLGLKVGKVLAEALEERQLASTIQLALDHAKAKIDRTLWTEQDGFYHAWWDHEKGSPDWLMADSLYGQVCFAVFFPSCHHVFLLSFFLFCCLCVFVCACGCGDVQSMRRVVRQNRQQKMLLLQTFK